MKKVTLLLPDTMTRIEGGREVTHWSEIDVDEKSIKCALSYKRDYHLDFCFPEGTVKVLSVENVLL